MANKQGGKGKKSSPSRAASHVRGPKRTEINREIKMARHARKHGLTKAQMAEACQGVKYPRVSKPFEGQRVVLSQTVKETQGPHHLVIVAGVLVNISEKQSEAISTINSLHSRLGYSHEILHDLGRRTLVSARAFN